MLLLRDCAAVAYAGAATAVQAADCCASWLLLLPPLDSSAVAAVGLPSDGWGGEVRRTTGWYW